VAEVRRVLTRYGAAGGGLMAGGLAYSALFAIVPAILLTAGIAGLLAHDPATRAGVVNTISQVVPPLRSLVDLILNEAANNAASGSIVGLVALAWGASRFAVAFQDAIARLMGGTPRGGIFVKNLAAFAAVSLMIVALFVGTALAGVAAFLDAEQTLGVFVVIGQALTLALALLPGIAAIVAIAVVYRIVPLQRPSWRVVGPPAIVVGIAMTVLGRVFVFIAPRLIGSAALLGTVASAFAALAWLGLSFQAILIGAAWVGERSEARAP
jgi:membrane protein